MPFELVYHPDVKKIDLPKLDSRSKAMIKRAIEERLHGPSGAFRPSPQGIAKGFLEIAWSEGYRIVFKLFDEKILILAIVDRKTVYRPKRTPHRMSHSDRPVN